jgi:uncharacterized protein (DUF1501 family)
MPERRAFLQSLAAGALASAMPGLSLAQGPGDARLVLVILRGALDGLAAVPPLGDPDYASVRGPLALSPSALRKTALDRFFCLHPSLPGLMQAWQREELLVLHAIASPYRERSHFDGQDLLETGAAGGAPLRDGWLNRALREMPDVGDSSALGLGSTLPLVLRGDAPANSWMPSALPGADDDTLERLAMMYQPDPLLATRLERARAADALAGTGRPSVGRGAAGQFRALAAAAARFLREPDGPRIAVLEAGGWDTHANQGADGGRLANRLAQLDAGLTTLAADLGPAWRNTAIAIVTEFGRTVAVNGSGGTDHGTGGCAFLLGGAVAGGRVLADWPGMARGRLYQGRDLLPTADLRALFKGLLQAQFGLSGVALNARVFPGSAAVRPLTGLLQA